MYQLQNCDLKFIKHFPESLYLSVLNLKTKNYLKEKIYLKIMDILIIIKNPEYIYNH